MVWKQAKFLNIILQNMNKQTSSTNYRFISDLFFLVILIIAFCSWKTTQQKNISSEAIKLLFPQSVFLSWNNMYKYTSHP